jgi:N-acetylneuraminic acid mutarotase
MMPHSLFVYSKLKDEKEYFMKSLSVSSESNKNVKKLNFKNKIKRTSHSSVNFKNQLYIFGGENEFETESNDLFQINFQNESFDEIETFGQIPTPRCHHSCSLYGEYMFIVGGYHGNFVLNDIFQYHFETRKWKEIKLSKSLPRTPMHSSVIYKDKMYLFESKLIEIDLIKLNWKYIEYHNNKKPVGRWGHRSFIEGSKMWIIGGFAGNYLNDVWFYDIENDIWIEIETKGEIFAPCRYQGIFHVDRRLYLFGGMTKFQSHENSLYEFNLTNFSWKKMKFQSDEVVERSGMTLTNLNNFIYIYGGNTGVNVHDDVFESFLEIEKFNFSSHFVDVFIIF